MSMSIKKRLLVSNIIMILVPIVIAVIIGICCLFVMLNILLRGGKITADNDNNVFWVSQVAAELAEHLVSDDADGFKDMERLKDMLYANDMRLVIRDGTDDDDDIVFSLGDENEKDASLIKAVTKIGSHKGTANNGTRNILMTYEPDDGSRWSIYILSTQSGDVTKDLKVTAFASVAVVMLAMLIAIWLTGQFMVRSVFLHISRPLELLTTAVDQIGEGNLDYRIQYTENDEFLPACNSVNEMAVRLKKSVEKSQQEETSRRELIAGISHDLRSPLTSIHAYTDGLLDNIASTPEMQRRYLETIRKKTVTLEQLVSQLFLFSKLELADYPMHMEKTDISRMIGSYLSALTEEYRKKGLIITTKLEPAFVMIDQEHFERVLSNIVSNSLKYKAADIGHLFVETKIIGTQCFAAFTDDGPGVSEEELSHLFDIFYRTDKSRKNVSNGSGLGLSITEKIIHHMNGTITAKAAQPCGLRLEILLPLITEEDTEQL